MLIIKTAFQISQPKFSLQLQKDTKPTKDILKGSLWVNTQIPSKFKVKVCLLEKKGGGVKCLSAIFSNLCLNLT